MRTYLHTHSLPVRLAIPIWLHPSLPGFITDLGAPCADLLVRLPIIYFPRENITHITHG